MQRSSVERRRRRRPSSPAISAAMKASPQPTVSTTATAKPGDRDDAVAVWKVGAALAVGHRHDLEARVPQPPRRPRRVLGSRRAMASSSSLILTISAPATASRPVASIAARSRPDRRPEVGIGRDQQAGLSRARRWHGAAPPADTGVPSDSEPTWRSRAPRMRSASTSSGRIARVGAAGRDRGRNRARRRSSSETTASAVVSTPARRIARGVDARRGERLDQRDRRTARPDLAQHRRAKAEPGDARGDVARRAAGPRGIERLGAVRAGRDQVDDQLAEGRTSKRPGQAAAGAPAASAHAKFGLSTSAGFPFRSTTSLRMPRSRICRSRGRRRWRRTRRRPACPRRC